MIQYMTMCCLYHANIITPSAIRLKLSNSRVAPSQVTKCHTQHQAPFIHICEGLGMRLLFPVHPNSSCPLKHSYTFAYQKNIQHLYFTLLLPIAKASLPQVSMTMFSFGVQCVSNFFTNQHNPDAKTLILVSIQLLMCCLQFLLWKQQTANDAYITTCPELGLQPNSFPGSTNRLAINQVGIH